MITFLLDFHDKINELIYILMIKTCKTNLISICNENIITNCYIFI